MVPLLRLPDSTTATAHPPPGPHVASLLSATRGGRRRDLTADGAVQEPAVPRCSSGRELRLEYVIIEVANEPNLPCEGFVDAGGNASPAAYNDFFRGFFWGEHAAGYDLPLMYAGLSPAATSPSPAAAPLRRRHQQAVHALRRRPRPAGRAHQPGRERLHPTVAGRVGCVAEDLPGSPAPGRPDPARSGVKPRPGAPRGGADRRRRGWSRRRCSGGAGRGRAWSPAGRSRGGVDGAARGGS